MFVTLEAFFRRFFVAVVLALFVLACVVLGAIELVRTGRRGGSPVTPIVVVDTGAP